MSATAPRSRWYLLPLGFLFLLSGAAGLVYEILWSRQLARVLGGSYPAVVAVVTVFLGGLALGAAWGGRFAPRLARPLRTYGLLEMGIGAYCALFPLILAALHPAFGWCYRHLGDSPGLHTAARFLVAAAALLPPTIAMGATLPVLVRAAVTVDRDILAGTGLLYGINTLGAAGGALLAGFVLLPGLGFRGTLWTGVAANVVVALLALLLDRAAAPAEAGETAPDDDDGASSPAPAVEPPSPAVRRVLLALAAGSGFTGMLYQLGWTRALVLCFGSSVHAFTLIVAVFILGLGCGGILASLVRAQGRRLVLFAVGLEALVGVAAWWSVAGISTLPLEVARATADGYPEYGPLLRWEAGRTLSVALLPTLAMGALFPVLIAAIAPRSAEASRTVGRVYAVNTAGVILGSLVGGLVLLPAFGTRAMLLAAVALNLLLAAGLLLAALPLRRAALPAIAMAGLGALLALRAPDWPPWRMHSGSYFYGSDYCADGRTDDLSIDRSMRESAWDMPYVAEGRSAGVVVIRNPDGSRLLRVNGKTDASTCEDRDTQLLLGHLSLLAHPDPQRVMVVGLASGMTAAAAAARGPANVDVAEISAEVVGAEPFFRPWNGNVLGKPGVRLLVEDGRTHLEHTDRLYDVIVSEPTNPWIAGVSDLFTVEYFRACRDRLAPGGVVGIWLQSYALSKDDFALVIRTLRSVLPNTTVWEVSPWIDYLLLAAPDETLDIPAAMARHPWPKGEGAAALAASGLRGPEDVLPLLFLGREEARAFAGEDPRGELHTDDRLQLEFRTPRGAFYSPSYARMNQGEIDGLRMIQPPPDPPGADPGRMTVTRWGRQVAREAQEAADAEAGGTWGGRTLSRISRSSALAQEVLSGVPAAARGPLEAWLRDPSKAMPPDAAEATFRAYAIARFEKALANRVEDVWAVDSLAAQRLARGERLREDGELDRAEADFRRALELQPWNAHASLELARTAVLRARAETGGPWLGRALALVDEALEKHPRGEYALVLRGEVLRALGRDAEASRALEHALEVRWDSLPALRALADLRLAAGRADEARALIDRGLALEPDDEELFALRSRAKGGW